MRFSFDKPSALGQPAQVLQTIASSFSLVAASEMGDKTQLLALALAARFKKPWAIMAGILLATLLNHGVASAVGNLCSSFMSDRLLDLIAGLSFLFFGFWILKPDTCEEPKSNNQWGAFFSTLVLFFFAEMGDKTQLATLALGARFHSIFLVTVGTTFGMLFSDGLAVFLGEEITRIISAQKIRVFSAFLFFGFGLFSLFSFCTY